MASVVIPAHDEATSIGGCLTALLADALPGELEVVVVANGCSDDTAAVARRAAASLPAEVLVVETPVASKTHALRVGDSRASAFPRLYLDADVTCPTSTARSIVDALVVGGADLAVPRRDLDLASASRLARRYYQGWAAMPRVQRTLAGRGLYAFSRAGRSRFGEFPDVVADDLWAVGQVPREAAQVVPGAVTVRPPARLADVLRVRARVYGANRTVAGRRAPGSAKDDLRHLVVSPQLWLDAAVFSAVTAVAKGRAALRGQASLASGRDAVRGAAR